MAAATSRALSKGVVSTTQRAGRAAATCTATPLPRLRPCSAMRVPSRSVRRAAQSYTASASATMAASARPPAARPVAAIVHREHRAPSVNALRVRRAARGLLGVAAEVDHQGCARAGRQEQHARQHDALAAVEMHLLERPPRGRRGPRQGRRRIEEQPLLHEPHQRGHEGVARDERDEEGLQRGQDRVSAASPTRPSGTRRPRAPHWRPSRMAHTTSDWPRRMSPAAKTLRDRGRVAARSVGGRLHVAARIVRHAELLEHPLRAPDAHSPSRAARARRGCRTRCPATSSHRRARPSRPSPIRRGTAWRLSTLPSLP